MIYETNIQYYSSVIFIPVGAHRGMLAAQDAKIESLNKKLKALHTTLQKANTCLLKMQHQATYNTGDEKNRTDLEKLREKLSQPSQRWLNVVLMLWVQVQVML